MDKLDKQNFYDFQNKIVLYKPTDKLGNIYHLINTYLNKTLAMFQYSNLPDSLPDVEIEKMLQMDGKLFITEYNDDIVALKIDLIYDDVDVYGNAKTGNVYYPDTKTHDIVNLSDGVLIENDYLALGLMEIFKKYAYLINESAISLNMANFWKRTEKVFTANDDATAESVKKYLSKTKKGEIGLVTSNLLYESIQVNSPQANGTSLGELIEYHNYLKSQLYAEIGLYTNENMKKERLITSEVETGLNAIYPLVDNMLDNRVQGFTKVNVKYGLDIQVEFMSSWQNKEVIEDFSDLLDEGVHMEETIINVISNVGFPIAVSIALFYQMTKTNETYINLLRDFQEVINNNTKSIELFNVTVQRLEREMGYGKDEVKKSKD